MSTVRLTAGFNLPDVPAPRSTQHDQYMTKAVKVRGLRKEYPGQVAVDGLDLDIERGEVFALLGPNGAGKTTTVEILEGHRARRPGAGQGPEQAGGNGGHGSASCCRLPTTRLN